MIFAVGKKTIGFVNEAKDLLALVGSVVFAFLRQILSLKFRYRETLEQIFLVGVLSFPVIGFSLAFVSLMLILEFSFHMKMVLRQDSLVPAFSTLLMLRELGPVVSCLLLASRVGAGIAAEIGTMRVTEQLDALKLFSVDAIEYLVVPRWIACVFGAVCLTISAIAIGIVAGASIASAKLGYPSEQFFHSMFLFAHFHDFTIAILKATVFGTIIPIVASYHGFQCRPGSEGVGGAATDSVVQSSLLIIIADFVLTYLSYAV